MLSILCIWQETVNDWSAWLTCFHLKAFYKSPKEESQRLRDENIQYYSNTNLHLQTSTGIKNYLNFSQVLESSLEEMFIALSI